MNLIGIECASSALADEFAALVTASLGGQHVLREERDLFSNHNTQKFALKRWDRDRVRVGIVVQSPHVARTMMEPGSEQRQLFDVQTSSSPRVPACSGHVYLRCPGEKDHRTLEQWYRAMHESQESRRVLVLDPSPQSESELARAVETFRTWAEQHVLNRPSSSRPVDPPL